MGWHKQLKFVAILSVVFFCWQVGGKFAAANEKTLIPMGHSISIKMDLTGVFITNDLLLQNDEWLKAGDFIEKVNDSPIADLTEFEAKLNDFRTETSVKLQLSRNNEPFEVEAEYEAVKRFLPFLRDSTEGTGTLTYVDPEKKVYGALGHQIIDSSFKSPPSFKDGTIHLSAIDQIRKSSPGSPGYKISSVVKNAETLGTIQKNVVFGIFGAWQSNEQKILSKPLQIMQKDRVKTGKAEIFTTVEGTEVESFSIEITSVEEDQFHFTLTDPVLLEKTGGILQGMSGSPVIQDGQFAGAVTHMFVDEPEKGAALFLETMRDGEE